ncbi:MAG: T9SS type A sorting domain-containing protein [Saprospiraceae bacterium]
MKLTFTFLFSFLLSMLSNAQVLLTCKSSCAVPHISWSTIQCENYQTLGIGQDLITNDWKKYPSIPSQNYYPVSAKIKLQQIGVSSIYADFVYKGNPIDNYYHLNIPNEDYRFNFNIYVFSSKRAQVAVKDAALNDIIYLVFQTNGTTDIFNKSSVKIGSFTYNPGTWINMNLFYHGAGSMEIFRNYYKVANLNNFPTANASFPSNINYYAASAGDEFLLGEVCLIDRNTINYVCVLDYNPVCLKGTGETVGTNSCYGNGAGYFSDEFQLCTTASDPCADCDECFNYWFDCSDYRKLYLQNNYCDELVPTFQNPSIEFKPSTEYEWEFKNSNNVVIQPEFLNNTTGTSFSPICRFPSTGSYTVCLKVYKYQASGRYLAYTCCYIVQVANPCKSTPTLFINSGNVASNGEISFTTTTTDADNFSWRCGIASANIPNQNNQTSSFKCKFPSGINCMTVCLTVGNACGMISKCITVCNTNSGCGSKPPSHPPITYQVNENGELSFNNVPQMETYDWTIPSGCSFSGGTDRGSRSPICKLPDINCNYMFCLKMKVGCYTCCYCFTIRKTGSGGTVGFDPDEMSCVPSNTTIKVPVRVKNFENMSSVDLIYNISPTNVANFVIAEAGPNVDPNSIIPNKLSNSRLQVGWSGSSGVNTSLQDNDILYYLVLLTTGTANSSATISIESATAKVKQNRITVPSILNTGSICINGSFKVCGKIVREDLMPVRAVNVELSGASAQTTTTDALGNYCFNAVPAGNYTIKPQKTINPGNGVEIADIADLKGHLLQTYTIPTPYRLIAADVDNNKQITATDIARIIPTYKDKARVFVNVNSWRFVPKSYQFPNAANPFQSTFPEVISVNLTKDAIDLDFVGIKMGDLDLDNDPQSLVFNDKEQSISKPLSQRSVPNLDLIVPSDTVRPGAILKIPIYCKGFNQVLSLGFSMNWEKSKLKFIKVNQFNSKLGISAGNFALQNTANGNLGVTWYTFDLNGVTLTNQEALFYLEFEVLAADKEQTIIAFSNLPTPITFADPLDNFTVNTFPATILIDAGAVAVQNIEESKEDFRIYPNPATDRLYILSDEIDFRLAEIQITSILGQNLFSMSSKLEEHNSIDISGLKSGSYIIQLKVKGKISYVRFVKI